MSGGEFIYMGIVLPASTRESIDRYVEHGVPTGGFLRAVLSNDLSGACERADVYNQIALCCIVAYLYNKCPGACWGSPESVAAWLKKHEDRRAAARQEVPA